MTTHDAENLTGFDDGPDAPAVKCQTREDFAGLVRAITEEMEESAHVDRNNGYPECAEELTASRVLSSLWPTTRTSNGSSSPTQTEATSSHTPSLRRGSRKGNEHEIQTHRENHRGWNGLG
jgi:hypothetical protein